MNIKTFVRTVRRSADTRADGNKFNFFLQGLGGQGQLMTRLSLLCIVGIMSISNSAIAGTKFPTKPESESTRDDGALGTKGNVEARLRDPDVQKVFKNFNATNGRSIQEALFEVYKHDTNFLKDYEKEKKPLSDQIVGKVTMSWIRQFCSDYNILANDPDFANQIVLSLVHVGDIARQHPKWREVLLSNEFEDWINQQPSNKQVEIYKIRRSGAAPQINALLEEYANLKRAPVVAAAPENRINISYQLKAHSLQEQENKQAMIEKLKTLIGPPYDDRRSFQAAVTAALQGVAVKLPTTLPIIEENARQVSYIWSAAASSRLSVIGAPSSLLDELQVFFDEEYKSEKDFDARLSERISTGDAIEALKIYRPRIIENAKVTRYEITEDSLERLLDSTVPPVVLEMLDDLKEVDYPTETLLEKAIEWRFFRSINPCRQTSFKNVKRMTDENFSLLMAAISGKENLVKEVTIFRQQLVCNDFESTRAAVAVEEVFNFFLPRLKNQMLFKVVHSAPPQVKADHQWSVSSCSCLLDTMSGQAYGFYPFWLDANKQQLNFGLLSRIGLYGLSFNESGDLLRDQAEGNKWPVDLIKVAHKYRTQIDWVIQKNDWRVWAGKSKEDKTIIFNTLKKNIVKLLTQDEGGVGLFDRGGKDFPIADGVTLYFDGMPDSDLDVFNVFFEELVLQLNSIKPRKRLNVLVSHQLLRKLDTTPLSLGNLSALIIKSNFVPKPTKETDKVKEQPLDAHILVLLAEPISESKKQLRAEIERALHGENRVRILRDTIPVLEFDGSSWNQLEDDIIYFADNFGGIGFWPLPANKGEVPGKNSVDQFLLSRFLEKDTSLQSAVCKVVCPNRTYFRGGFILTIVLLAIWGLAYFNCCSCRARLQMPLYQVALVGLSILPLVLAIALLFCDPLIKEVSAGYLSVIVVIFLVIVYLVWSYFDRDAKKIKP